MDAGFHISRKEGPPTCGLLICHLPPPMICIYADISERSIVWRKNVAIVCYTAGIHAGALFRRVVFLDIFFKRVFFSHAKTIHLYQKFSVKT